MPEKLADLTAATSLADADLFYLEQGGTAKQLPASAAAASLTAKGFAELATQAEVNAGTDAERIVTPSTLLARPSAFMRLYHAQEQKATGVASATALSAAAAAAVARRDLVEVVDTLGADGSGGGSVGGANNTQITLPAGTYWFEANAMVTITVGAAGYIYGHRLELYDTTSPASLLHGPTFRIDGGQLTADVATAHLATIFGRFSLDAQKVLELRHWGVDENASVTTVLGGTPSGAGLGSFGEIYADIMARQLVVG